MSSERSFWDNVKNHLSPFGMLHRVENRIDTGTGDVAYCLKRKPMIPAASGWIELKEDTWPIRSGTPFIIKSLTLEQVQFLEAWAKAGGRAWLMAQVDRDFLLWKPAQARVIFERRYYSSTAIAAASLRWKSPWPLAQILDHLAGYENVHDKTAARN